MPLHLLGKKSWNVYNPANIARVRRDEAEAAAREAAEEQRMQELDAARRLAILRGEVQPPLEEGEPDAAAIPPVRDSNDRRGFGRKRKRHGEDDTDFEMRLARERAAAGDHAARELELAPNTHPAAAPASLVDSKGHISLFPEVETGRSREKNEEVTKEAARKERELKDQYQMRFVNAAGRDGQGLTDGGPWYASADGEASGALVPSKNVWAREDPGRKVREAARLDAGDPLAMMKKAAAKVRELEQERKKEVERRERELKMLEDEEKRECRRRDRKRRKEGDGENRRERPSSVDKRADSSVRREHSHRGHDRDPGRHRDRSEERERHNRGRRFSPDRGRDPDRHEPSRRHHEERHRHRSRERGGRGGRGEEGSHERRRHRDEERRHHHHRDYSKETPGHGSDHR
ncbi:uncharacterized protein B0T15DRAFT_228921 [Chaetomium strumarium]|uniref:CBF1-interacting co-repressor CIR N-terminal domain-containing protein n=1 Tax=Chaetomium strumarium TaxID=1170767 RepID=A0AAJ0GQ21_9PEZI|nr:hypothetical protein B0T15DRAFT_228921 [Chaetomium strumarium]